MVPIIVSGVSKRTSIHALVRCLVIGAVAFSLGCSGTTAANESSKTVVVSTSIWGDVVENLLCDEGTEQLAVEVLFATNADPHTAEVHLSDRANLSDAALIIVNGSGLEATLSDTIDAVGADGVPVLDLSSELADHVVANDPHFWLDPTIVAAAIDPLSQALDTAGADAAALTSCAERYREQLVDLDNELSVQFDALSDAQKRLAALHGLGYFARHFGLDIVATVDPGTDHGSPSPAALAETIAVMEQQDVRVLATEVHHQSDDVNAIKASIGDLVEVPLYTGGLDDDAQADTYVEMMQENTRRLSAALDS